jgi:hypothetical protein
MLPKHIRQSFNLHWRPIFEVMEACPGLNHLADEDSFERGIGFLKSRAEYVFNKRRAKPMQWELSTWSKQVRRLSIEKNGTKLLCQQERAATTSHAKRVHSNEKENRLTTGVEAGNHHDDRGRQLQHYQHYHTAAAAPAATMNCQIHLLDG